MVDNRKKAMYVGFEIRKVFTILSNVLLYL